MKNLTLLFILTFTLLGCSTTVPVKRTFPSVPVELQAQCVELNQVPEGTQKLSEILTSVTKNYSEYHICRNKVELWIEWYDTQKKIFDEVQ